MKLFRFAALVSLLLLMTATAFGQGAVTGALTGTVTTDGVGLPGATVTVSSPALQGTRMAITDENGNYNLVGLPPGDYTVRIELEGLQTVTRTARVTLSGTARVDADMRVSAVTEAITVTASAPAVLETTEVQANFQKEQVDELPIGRGVQAIANLAPGVTNNGPNNAMMISGAMSYDNLILVDGATVQENLRGQARPLYIEDAIQETTVITGGVSAEFGRFTGGVVNSITKSGGNEFSGSLRDTLTDPSWTEPSAAGEERAESKIGNVYEATLGGRIIRDRLWFFLAGRMREDSGLARHPTLIGESEQIFSETTNNRYQAKLTGQIASRHSLIATYLDNPLETTNDIQPVPGWEMSAFDPSFGQLEDFLSLHYNGVFTNSLLGEVNYSQRNFTFDSLGGDSQDLILGTPLRTYFGTNHPQNGVANAPWFCGTCGNETRDMELVTAKLNYFLGSRSLGTHNIVGGVERFSELRTANNWQSGSGLTVWLYHEIPTRREDGRVLFTMHPGDSVESFRVDNPSLGSDLTTDSIFINDKWDLNQHFSFNLGARWDRTDAVDQAGNPTADESSISPRLAVTYDPTGTGAIRIGATYGTYVGRLSESVQGAGANAGDPNWYGWYTSDDPNFEAFTGTAEEVVAYAINWWQSRGGFDLAENPPTNTSIGGVSTQLAGSLLAPDVREWTVGAGWQYSPNGYVRADYIDRDWDNFYVAMTNASTGQVQVPGGVSDLTLVTNTNQLDRTYQAVQLQANQRFFNRLNVGGSYTWSELRGNAEGENVGSGPITTGGWIFQYPEYQGFAQNNPFGFLSSDQTHKLRAWAGIDIPLGPAGVVNLSVLQRFDSGTPYSASALLNPPTVEGTSYVDPPTSVTYYFSDRGEFRWDDVSRTDFALNYHLPVLGRAELFFEGEVFNLFNEQAQIGGSTTIVTGRNTQTACGTEAAPVRCANFNPFTDTPVEGVHYARLTPESAARLNLGPSTIFGNATSSAHYQIARTYQFSVGLRF